MKNTQVEKETTSRDKHFAVTSWNKLSWEPGKMAADTIHGTVWMTSGNYISWRGMGLTNNDARRPWVSWSWIPYASPAS